MASERPDKKEKKDKKRSEADGVTKPKKDKKEKKEKKDKLAAAVETQLQAESVSEAAAPVVVDTEGVKKVVPAVKGALVPFAVPLADDKAMKKVMKSIRKGKSLHPPNSHPHCPSRKKGGRSMSIPENIG